MESIRHDPIIYTIQNFVSNTDCDHIINLAKDKVQPALVSGDKEGFVSEGRSGQNCWISHGFDTITKTLSKRIAGLVNIPLENAEAFQVIYYDKNQEYRQHYDGWLFDHSEKSIRNMKYGGQRMVTALAYLNTVPAGGGTRFTKLDIEVAAEKGKLLIFHNTYGNTNERHELSEHAGMPVIDGEKWAFNLWFREKTRKIEYKYPAANILSKEQADLCSINILNDKEIALDICLNNLFKQANQENQEQIPKIVYQEDFISSDDITKILALSKFEDKDRTSSWINNSTISSIISKISQVINIDQAYLENACVTRYRNQLTHRDHLDAYDLTTDKGKEYTKLLGQRLLTITIFLSPFTIKFPKLDETYDCNVGTMLFYNNCHNNTNTRDDNLIKSYMADVDNLENYKYILNLYVREKSRTNKKYLRITANQREYCDGPTPTQVPTQTPTEEKKIVNYEQVIDNIYNKTLDENLRFKDFKIINRAPTEYITETLKQIRQLKIKNSTFLNQENIDKKYFIDEYNPVIVENVISPEIHQIINDYFKENIKNGVYPFGDRQANRYKIVDEVITRLLHIEFLPLIEKIIGRKMEATYTYLSAYLKGTSLPPHTDRADCEFTCSYIIGKPPGLSWNIYVHKTKQPQKYKGRYDFTPPKEECIAVDCAENGLMIFNGTDHIHFREELELDYYNIVLLHYRTID